jgi:hypothetical protein
VQLFSNAEAIVAPSVAGLMNQLFTDSAVVVELLGNKQTKTSPGVYYYANLLGYQYGCVPGGAVGADIRADVTEIRILLKRFLNGSRNYPPPPLPDSSSSRSGICEPIFELLSASHQSSSWLRKYANVQSNFISRATVGSY